MSASPARELSFNGVNATTGGPLRPPMTAAEVARLACGERRDPAEVEDLRRWWEHLSEDRLELRHGLDPRRLDEAGWGVVFPHGGDESVRRALAPLLEHRRARAAATDERLYRELEYRPGESKLRFLARHGVGPGPVEPQRLPYYLLLVGGPEEIPFRFQYQLDVQYAVGRLHLDGAESYARYAHGVVEAENGEPARPRRAAFFGVANRDDRATARSLRHLVTPLAERAAGWSGWSVETALGDAATKTALGELLTGAEAPALLFTAGHGVGFEPDDPRQLRHQGALLCAEWPGPERWRRAIPEDHYLSADDVPDDAGGGGQIAFFFACYGAGTPRHHSFAAAGDRRRRLAPHGFVAELPRRLLGHPGGGALAVVGHVDQAWSYSFDWPRAGEQRQVFDSALDRLVDGYPVGAAMEFFDQRHAELSSDLGLEIEEARYGATPDLLGLSALWTAHNDARSYVVLGDPAVRLAVGREAG